jgi:8-oxo-dGTP pyrophosphatase MutT (NUDIX family)
VSTTRDDRAKIKSPVRRGPWLVHADREIYRNPWIRITEHDVTHPTGAAGIYGVVHLQNLAVGCVPILDDGSVILVGQHRFPLDVYSWELPEGGGAFDDPQGSAERELKEETGYSAASWLPLVEMDLSNAVTDERAVGFLAWDLTEGVAEPDEAEELALRRVPFAEAFEMAMTGEIRDSFSQTMLMKTDILGRRGALPDKVAELLGYR